MVVDGRVGGSGDEAAWADPSDNHPAHTPRLPMRAISQRSEAHALTARRAERKWILSGKVCRQAMGRGRDCYRSSPRGSARCSPLRERDIPRIPSRLEVRDRPAPSRARLPAASRLGEQPHAEQELRGTGGPIAWTGLRHHHGRRSGRRQRRSASRCPHSGMPYCRR